MPLVQGRCKNCGSIINVDSNKDDAVCMFCWAHTSPSEAIAIDANPDAYEFPNESMPEPSVEEQSLAFGAQNSGKNVPVKKSKPAIKKSSANKKMTPAEKVAMAKKELFEPVVPKKQKLLLLGITAAVVILVAALVIPLTLSRNTKREALHVKMPALISGQNLTEQNYSLEGQNNSKLTLVLPEEVSESKLKDIYDSFKLARADVYGLDAADTQDDVRIKVYASNGLLEMSKDGVNNIVQK